MTTLYIAGPMSGIEDFNFPAFHAAAEALEQAGYEPSNPADDGVTPGWTWEQYLRRALRRMLLCDGVALLENWWDSKGANLEVMVAKRLGMPVQLVDEWIATGTPGTAQG